MNFDPNERRGQLVTTSRPSEIRDGKGPVARCEASVTPLGDECGLAIQVAWEDLPRVWDGSIRKCHAHREDDVSRGVEFTAEQVAENVKARRAEWDARCNQRKAA